MIDFHLSSIDLAFLILFRNPTMITWLFWKWEVDFKSCTFDTPGLCMVRMSLFYSNLLSHVGGMVGFGKEPGLGFNISLFKTKFFHSSPKKKSLTSPKKESVEVFQNPGCLRLLTFFFFEGNRVGCIYVYIEVYIYMIICVYMIMYIWLLYVHKALTGRLVLLVSMGNSS